MAEPPISRDEFDAHRWALEGPALGDRVRRELALARARTTATGDLIELLRNPEVAPDVVLLTLNDRARTDEHSAALVRIAQELAAYPDEPSEIRTMIDRRLPQILGYLPEPERREMAIALVGHRRKPRRAAGIQTLHRMGLDRKSAAFVLDRYRQTGEKELFALLLRHGEQLDPPDVLFLLEAQEHASEPWPQRYDRKNSHACYQRARLIESLLQRAPLEQLATDYPYEFVWAVGRARDQRQGPTVRRLVREHRTEFDFVGLGVWTLSRLEMIGALSELESLIDSAISEHHLDS